VVGKKKKCTFIYTHMKRPRPSGLTQSLTCAIELVTCHAHLTDACQGVTATLPREHVRDEAERFRPITLAADLAYMLA